MIFPCGFKCLSRECGPQRAIGAQANQSIAKRVLTRLVHHESATVLAAIFRHRRVGRSMYQDRDASRKVFSDLTRKGCFDDVAHVRFERERQKRNVCLRDNACNVFVLHLVSPNILPNKTHPIESFYWRGSVESKAHFYVRGVTSIGLMAEHA